MPDFGFSFVVEQFFRTIHPVFDFILEEDNKDIKAWIPKGTPSMEMWQSVIRNTENLSKIKEKLLDTLGLQHDHAIRKIDVTDAIQWRRNSPGLA